MSDVVAAVEVPDTAAVAEATRLVRETTNPLTYHHSRRVYFLGELHARLLGMRPDPELFYLAAMFHDTGLLTPFTGKVQRFEIDGADHARKFLLEHGFSAAAGETVWAAIALHSTPEVPVRLGPEIAALHLGAAADLFGIGLDRMDADQVTEILEAHPRGDFTNDFLRMVVDGLKMRPETTIATVWADALERGIPDFQRANTVDWMVHSPWQN